MKPMIFCKIGWMKKYQGIVNDHISGGGKYVGDNGIGHEVYNFLEVDGKYYGFVRINGGGNLNLNKIREIYNNQDYIDNVIVVWVSKNPKNEGVYIVGWYKNAKVYKTLKSPPMERIKRIDEDLESSKKENRVFEKSGKDFSYLFEANVHESTLLDEEDRTFKLPKKKMNQTNHWYANKEEDLDFKTRVNNYINQENPDEKLNNIKNVDKMFNEDTIKKVEFNQYLREKGFYFDQETIENFLLSLKVKPFLILTGNSGTGKTKLAQLFAKHMETKIINSFNDNIISFKRKVGKSHEFKGWNIGNSGKYLVSEKIQIKYADIDGIRTDNIKLDPTPRIFYNDEKIQSHLKKVAEDNKDKEIDITLFLNNPIEIKKMIVIIFMK